MPKPVPPSLIAQIAIKNITLNARARKAVAKPLGLATLPIDPIRKLERLIAIYQATARGLKGTTPGGTLAVFDEIERSTKRLASALRYFKNDRSGVDAETFDAMSPTARECLSSIERLCSVAEVQRARLRKHPRVYPAQEALRYFCGMLRLFFEHSHWQFSQRLALTTLILNPTPIVWTSCLALTFHPMTSQLGPKFRSAAAASIPRDTEGAKKSSFSGVEI